MMSGGVRSRLAWAALAPVFLVSLALMAAFWSTRMRDAREDYAVRVRLMASQVAIASEYGVFSGNTASLDAIAEGAANEPEVLSVGIFDAAGQLLATSGTPGYRNVPQALSDVYREQQKGRGVDVVVLPVAGGGLTLDDYFTLDADKRPDAGLGQVVLEVSRAELDARGRETLLVALVIGIAGFVLGSLLALRLLDAATRELRLRRSEAEAATLSKSRFLAAASHDLRQPTHALGMFVARLGQLPLDEPTREVVGNMEASVHAMQDLLDGLLDVTRLEAGAVQAKPVSAPVEDIFQSLRASLQPLAQSKGLRLRVRATDEWFFSDPVLLQSMLINLASNALRYTERGTVLIACRVTEGGTRLRFDVSDSGIGIAPEHQQAIFQEFFQVGNAGRDRALGMGLGLNIVERTARLLGHTLALRSQVGCGTRFSVTVPRGRVLETATSAPTADALLGAAASVEPGIRAGFGAGFGAGAGELAGLRVLLVEDDALVRQSVQALLGSWGCVVDAAEGLNDALTLVESGPAPDLLLSDYRLGDGRNGMEAIATLRACVGTEVPACLMSGDVSAELMQSARAAGLTLLHKPVRPAKLRSFLRHLALARR